MSNKIKIQTRTEIFSETAKQAGILLMTAAATVGMLDLPGAQPEKRVVLPTRPAFAFASNLNVGEPNPLRREREEVAPHYISYSVVQRTAASSGKK